MVFIGLLLACMGGGAIAGWSTHVNVWPDAIRSFNRPTLPPSANNHNKQASNNKARVVEMSASDRATLSGILEVVAALWGSIQV